MHDETPKGCCLNLRCKSMYYTPAERPGRLRDDESMGYWCHKTADALGPDDLLASHRNCQDGRGCFIDKVE
jgi:hypothetical protein